MDSRYDFKQIGIHLLLIVLAVASLRGFAINRQWALAPSRRASMKPVNARVLGKWLKIQDSMRGSGFTYHVLTLESREGCSCKGEAEVEAELYNRTAVGGSIKALCFRGVCYSPQDRRWDEDYRRKIWAYLLLGLVCIGIEAALIHRYFKE